MNFEEIVDGIIGGLILRIFDFVFGFIGRSEVVDEVRHSILERLHRRGVWSAIASMLSAICTTVIGARRHFHQALFMQSGTLFFYFSTYYMVQIPLANVAKIFNHCNRGLRFVLVPG